jgi:hypothetical protein
MRSERKKKKAARGGRGGWLRGEPVIIGIRLKSDCSNTQAPTVCILISTNQVFTSKSSFMLRFEQKNILSIAEYPLKPDTFYFVFF